MRPMSDRPLAAKGLISYRYPSPYRGWIMIGARDDQDALRQANRSLTLGKTDPAKLDKLEVWDAAKDRYVSVDTPRDSA